MGAVLLDTNVWSWTMLGSRRLTLAARLSIEVARTRYLSPVSLYAIGQKARLGKWPEIAPHVPRLRDVAEDRGLELAKLDGDVCLLAGTMDWAQRDPFDRLLATTSLQYGIPIISADPVFDGVVQRIW